MPYGFLYYIVKVHPDGIHGIKTADVWYNKITEPIALHIIRPLYAVLWAICDLFVDMPEEGPMFIIKVPESQKQAFHDASGCQCGGRH